MLDFSRFKALTFDCYGTLIDWESGIFSAMKPILDAHDKNVSDSQLLELYAEFEVAAEEGAQFAETARNDPICGSRVR